MHVYYLINIITWKEVKLLAKLYSHGCPEHTETTVKDSELLVLIGTVDDVTLAGHWQTSKVIIEISNTIQL